MSTRNHRVPGPVYLRRRYWLTPKGYRALGVTLREFHALARQA